MRRRAAERREREPCGLRGNNAGHKIHEDGARRPARGAHEISRCCPRRDDDHRGERADDEQRGEIDNERRRHVGVCHRAPWIERAERKRRECQAGEGGGAIGILWPRSGAEDRRGPDRDRTKQHNVQLDTRRSHSRDLAEPEDKGSHSATPSNRKTTIPFSRANACSRA